MAQDHVQRGSRAECAHGVDRELTMRTRTSAGTVRSLVSGALLSALVCGAAALAQPALAQNGYRAIDVDRNANPFLGPPDTGYGGSKHVWWVWHPLYKRVYTWGGDYGVGAASFGQPDMGATFTAGSGRTYQRDSSLNNDQYSIDPYAAGPNPWRLEHPYLPRDMGGGVRESRPGRPDQVSLVWDSRRNKLWGIITVLRTEFLYRLPDGTPDLWANGDMTTSGNIEPTGTWSFAPNPSGGTGTWTFETTARVAYRSGAQTAYQGDVLVTGSGDERVANWQYDPQSDRIVAFGTDRVFVFNPETKTYEHHPFSPTGYGYFNPCSSYVAIVGEWMYGVAMARQNGVQQSVLVRVNIPRMLALANGAGIPQDTSYREVFLLPWSLSPGGIWEQNNNGSAKWQEHAGVMGVDGKVVVVASYDGLVDNGVAKLAMWDPVTRAFTNAPLPPDQTIIGNSWVALPDSGEVLFGLNSYGFTNSKLWAYKVGVGATAIPRPPTNLQVN
jgi:hypothetical protein